MSSSVTVAGNTYQVPAKGDSNWGTDVSSLLVALSDPSKVFQVSTTSFNLQQDLSFGNNYGLKTVYLKSQSINPASAGYLRLGSDQNIAWRNNANNADVVLNISASDKIQIDSEQIALNKSLPPVGSILPFIGGYFADGSNGTFTNVLGNTVANVNALLNSSGWYVCDGAALNDASSSIFNGASRYLPNLTDERFLQGSTTAGGIGGSNTMIDHTHAHSLTVAAHTHTFSGTSAADGAHSHTGTTGTESTGHTHSMLADYGYGNGNYWTNSDANRSGTKQTGGTSNTHTHTFSTSTSSTHTHTYSGTTSGASASSISGTVGSGSAATSTNNRPKYLSVFYIMRVK